MPSDSSLLARPPSQSGGDVPAGEGSPPAFAGYPLLDDLGPCPGGMAYRSVHPSLRTPVFVRRYRPDWLAPADSVEAFVGRARDAAPVAHPHLARLLDVGAVEGEPFAVLEPVAGADLFTLVTDIGPMPTALATAYTRQLAAAVQAAHDRGLVHGDVRPGTAFAGPLVPMPKPRADGTPRLRPGPTAAVTLCELGLVPRRPPATFWSVAGLPVADEVAFLPPERLDTGEPTAAGDVYGLGATAYFLLTGKPPFPAANPAKRLAAVRSDPPVPVAALRPDLDPALVALIDSMLAKDPAARPTIAEIVARLAGEPAAPPLTPAPPETGPAEDGAGLGANGVESVAASEADVPLSPAGPSDPAPEKSAADGADAWHDQAVAVSGPAPFPGFTDQAIVGDEATEPSAPVTTVGTPADRKKLYLWLGIGLGLQVLAVTGWIVFAYQPSWLSGPSDPPAKTKPVPRKAP